jgi:HSP20 family protein
MAQVPTTRSNQGSMMRRHENPLERMRRGFDNLFERFWAPFDMDFRSLRLWDFDVNENDREISVRAELPGFEPDELDLQVANQMLTIKAEKEQKEAGHEEYRSFYRTLALPPGINMDKVQATYRNGVLELHLPLAEGAQPKHITVQGSGTQEGAMPEQPARQAGEAAKAK